MVTKPTATAVSKLLELKVITEKDGMYVYSKEFEDTAKWLKEHKPGMLDSMRLAHEIDSECAPVLITYAKDFGNKNSLKNVGVAYVMLKKHLKRLNIDFKPDVNTIYATYYFNDHVLSVEDVKDELS
jgi:hypothetical protein